MPRLLRCGDGAILVSFAGDSDPRRAVAALDAALTADPPRGVEEAVPGIDSLLVVLDGTVSLAAARATLEGLAASLPPLELVPPRTPAPVQLPVRFGGTEGPDLQDLAARAGMPPEALVAMVVDRPLEVAIVGHLPGLPYLVGLPDALDVPRRTTPRTAVEAGSVGIAAGMACVYPMRAPGGWHIVGRTDAVLCDPSREPPFLLAPGDRVRFVEAR